MLNSCSGMDHKAPILVFLYYDIVSISEKKKKEACFFLSHNDPVNFFVIHCKHLSSPQ